MMTTNFVRDEFGIRSERFSERAREIAERGMEQGLGSADITENLHNALGERLGRGPGYWRIVANSFSNHARTYTQVGALADAGVETWMFSAVLDEVTSDICRFYHGKTWSVDDAMAHVEKIAALEDPEEIAAESPWIRTGRDASGNQFLWVPNGEKRVKIATIERSGVGSKDDVGEFSRGRSSASLAKLGAMLPPLHGDCRSTIVPV